MLRKSLFPVFFLFAIAAAGQYKNDNVLFKTVDPSDLCNTLGKNNGYLILDVRSKEEHNDVATSGVYNLGKIKGAVNIDVQELGKRLSEINSYKNQPVFVYCSHSQRSRRASKMLADSGYTNVFNINGGMTAIYYSDASEKGCLQSMIQTTNKYSIISGTELCQRINGKDNNIFVLDVRNDSAFRHISTEPQINAYGTVKGSVNIPLAELESRISAIPVKKDILVIDLFGSDAAKAAGILKEKGYGNVAVLIEGVSRWLTSDDNDLSCKKELYNSSVNYQLITATEFGQFAKSSGDYQLLDVRTTEEFSNKAKDSWRNIGHVKNAINIPAANLADRAGDLSAYKNKDIVIYSFSSSPETFAAASTLQKLGFTKIKVLMGGIFNLRWTSANRKGQAYLKDFVTDVPEINW